MLHLTGTRRRRACCAMRPGTTVATPLRLPAQLAFGTTIVRPRRGVRLATRERTARAARSSRRRAPRAQRTTTTKRPRLASRARARLPTARAAADRACSARPANTPSGTNRAKRARQGSSAWAPSTRTVRRNARAVERASAAVRGVACRDVHACILVRRPFGIVCLCRRSQ